MNPIVEEARNEIRRYFNKPYYPNEHGNDKVLLIIQSAIEKATEEGVEIGSMLMAGAVVKAFTEGGRFGFTDENDPRYKLNQILDSSAAHASEPNQ